MSGRKSSAKGARNERATVHLLKEMGIEAVRVPLSGAVAAFPGDVIATINGRRLRLECKCRSTGFATLYGWLAKVDALVVKADRRQPLVVLPLASFIEMTGAPQ